MISPPPLLHADIREHNNEAYLASHVTVCQDDDRYGVSVPLEEATDEEGNVLLAYAMNNQSLTPDYATLYVLSFQAIQAFAGSIG